MKSFKQYLTEAADRVYEFKIKLSYEPEAEQVSRIENALKSFDLVSMSRPKRLPMQEHPADFAAKGPIEVHVFEASVRYPATSEQVRNMIRERAGINDACLIVRTLREDAAFLENYIKDQDEGSSKKKALLDTELEDVKNDDSRTDRQAENLLKELAAEKKTPKQEYAAANSERVRTTNELPQGTTSPVGSHQNRIPDPVRSKGSR